VPEKLVSSSIFLSIHPGIAAIVFPDFATILAKTGCDAVKLEGCTLHDGLMQFLRGGKPSSMLPASALHSQVHARERVHIRAFKSWHHKQGCPSQEQENTMGFLSKPIKTLDDLFLHTLQDIYYAENQIAKNLPTMIQKASSTELKQMFEHHLKETETQIKRLEQVFKNNNQPPKAVTCQAMDGILGEAKEIIGDCDDAHVRDAAMLSAAQAVEHYEMTRYGTLIAFAEQLGKAGCARILAETLSEEKAADKKLSEIADARVNRLAA
jgi:ferritin-like metal-binding protein YciE